MRYSRDDDVLCCCEYFNEDGDRAHLLGLLCDCSEVDDAFDRLLKGDKWHHQQLRNMCSVLHDRCRFPWRGGARRIPLDIVTPWILVPSLMWISSFNLYTFVIVNVVLMPAIFCLVYRTCLREFNPKTQFYFSWSISTTVYLLYVYEYHVVGFLTLQKIISPTENFFLILFVVMGSLSLFAVKRKARGHFCKEGSIDDRRFIRYCKVCQSHVVGKDHHCVWIDECISSSNFKTFLAFLVVTAAALIHGGLLLLTSVCESSTPVFFANSILVPRSCQNFNQNFNGDPRTTFTAGLHCLLVAGIIFVLFSVKFFQFISKSKSISS